MPSSYSASGRYELQFTGENVNSWGVRLNGAYQRVDENINGVAAIALTGDYELTVENGDADEARMAILIFTGNPASACTVTFPGVSKRYTVRNGTTKNVILTTGGVTTVTVIPGANVEVFTDGTAVYELGYGGLGLKAYVDAVAWSYNAGNLPGVGPGISGFLKTADGANGWASPAVADISDYVSDQATREEALKRRARAYAIAL